MARLSRLAEETQAVKDGPMAGLPPAGVNAGYVLLDGTGAPMVPKGTAGRFGNERDGRAHAREAKIGVLFTQTCFDDDGQPVVDGDSATDVASFHDVHGFRTDLGVEAIRCGSTRLPRRVVFGDCAKWILAQVQNLAR